MKSILTILLICMFTTTIKATVLVVDNNINNTTAYALFQDAVNAAIAGDTIYVQPSNIVYDSPTLDKTLVIFGAGRRPNKQNQARSKVANIFLELGCDGSEIHGMVVTVIRATGINVSNITITKCELGRLEINGDNFFVENCVLKLSGFDYCVRVFDGPNNTPRNNLVFQNNIFKGAIRNMSGSGCTFRNNLFLPTGFYFSAFWDQEVAVSLIVENNIFYGSAPSNCFVCTFDNNITFSTNQDVLPYGNNTGTNNLIWIQNNFVDADLPITDFINNIYGYDLQIVDGQPGDNAGTDGKDIGLFGGAIPFSYPGEPAIPVVRNFILENASVPVNGNLQIQVLLSAPE